MWGKCVWWDDETLSRIGMGATRSGLWTAGTYLQASYDVVMRRKLEPRRDWLQPQALLRSASVLLFHEYPCPRRIHIYASDESLSCSVLFGKKCKTVSKRMKPTSSSRSKFVDTRLESRCCFTTQWRDHSSVLTSKVTDFVLSHPPIPFSLISFLFGVRRRRNAEGAVVNLRQAEFCIRHWVQKRPRKYAAYSLGFPIVVRMPC